MDLWVSETISGLKQGYWIVLRQRNGSQGNILNFCKIVSTIFQYLSFSDILTQWPLLANETFQVSEMEYLTSWILAFLYRSIFWHLFFLIQVFADPGNRKHPKGFDNNLLKNLIGCGIVFQLLISQILAIF